MKYQVILASVSRNHSMVTKLLMRILGEGTRDIKKILVKDGGVVSNDLTKAEADRLAGQLRELGAVVEVSRMENNQIKEGFRVSLTDAGNNKLLLIKEIRSLTGLDLKESKILAETLGVVGVYKTRKEAEQVKNILASAGAKLNIEKLGNPVPEPFPIEPEMPSEDDIFNVFGKVLLADGRPVEGCVVRVFDRDLRSEEFLGETVADSRGFYIIQYTKEQFKKAENKTTDLVVSVYNRKGELLVKSEIKFNSSQKERIDLTVPESAPVQPSEYEQLVALIRPLLENVPLSELTSHDVLFLTNETGCSLEEIAFIKDDELLAKRTGMPAGVFYGLARVQMGFVNPGEAEQTPAGQSNIPFIDLSMVMEEPTQRLLRFLDTAIARQLVPLELSSQRHEIEERFAEIV